MSVRLKGNTAIISVDDDIYDGYWWGISYRDIKDSLAEIEGQFTEVKVRVNSAGGSVTEGMAIRNELVRLAEDGFSVDVEVDGVAASIASVIALSGTSLKMRSGSYLMIHRPYTFASGDHEDLRAVADTVETMYDDVVDIYEQNSSLSRSEIEDYMDKETWFSSKMAVENGFAVESIPVEQDVVLNYAGSKGCRSIVMNRFKNVPSHILNSEVTETTPVESQQKGEVKMTLQECLAKYPEAKADYDAQIVAAKSDGTSEHADSQASIVARVKGVVASDKYSSSVRALAMDVLAGAKDVAALDAVVAMVDMQAEEASSTEAQTETEETGETSPESTEGNEETTVDNSGKVTASNYQSYLKSGN